MTRSNGLGRVPEARRLAIIADAVVYGEREAARRHEVSRNSIMNWLEPAGGLAAVRQHYAAVRDGALAEMEKATAQTFIKKVCQFSNDHLVQVFIEMLKARKESGTTIVNAPIAVGVVNDDAVGRAILAAERAYIEGQPLALGEGECKALESGDS